jgi:hypothetical protein
VRPRNGGLTATAMRRDQAGRRSFPAFRTAGDKSASPRLGGASRPRHGGRRLSRSSLDWRLPVLPAGFARPRALRLHEALVAVVARHPG